MSGAAVQYTQQGLAARDLSVGYGGKVVIGDIRFSAGPGQVVTLIGPNGAGKSTILKTLIGLLQPVSGVVLLGGEDLAGLSEKQVARTAAALLTGSPRPELMTCGDVVSSGRYPYTGLLGILSAHDRAVVRESMELVHVSDLRDRDFREISDGQRQRVLLARAICQEPEILVLDEPTSYLDIRHKLDFLYLLRRLVRERRLAVILSLHELELAQRFSDTVLCVRDGVLDRAGPPEEIFGEEGYIASLYGLEHGTYDALNGCVEAQRPEGTPRVFVLGGGGSGIPVYRRLTRLGVPFAAGVLPENDADVPVARALAAELVTDAAFEPVGAAAVDRALEILAQCRGLICTTEHFGTLNAENRRLLDYAKARNLLLPNDAGEEL